MELRAHGVVVVASHGTYFGGLGRQTKSDLEDLLNEPVYVSLSYCKRGNNTYDSANSICEWFLSSISVYPASVHHALTIVGATQYPGELMVKEDRPDIVQMAVQCEQASSRLI